MIALVQTVTFEILRLGLRMTGGLWVALSVPEAGMTCVGVFNVLLPPFLSSPEDTGAERKGVL